MTHALIAHSDPEVVALLAEALGQLAPAPTWKVARNVAEASRAAMAETFDLVAIEAQLPSRDGEIPAAGAYPGVVAASTLGIRTRALPALLVIGGEVTKRLLRLSGRVSVHRFLPLDGNPERDCVGQAARSMAALLHPGRRAAEPVSARIDLRLGDGKLAYAVALRGRGLDPVPGTELKPLCIKRSGEWGLTLEEVRRFSPLRASGGVRAGLQLEANWDRGILSHGSRLFSHLLEAGLQDAYESALEHCDNRWDRLHLRFEVTPELHDVAVEYLADAELGEPNLLMLRSPMERSLGVADGQANKSADCKPRLPRILCVLSDVEDDTVVRIEPGAWEGVSWPESLPKLLGLQAEAEYFRSLGPRVRLLPDPELGDDPQAPLIDLLRRHLAEAKPYDIIHFSGHCHAPPRAAGAPPRAFLMLARPDRAYADPLSAEVFALWLRQRHNARLVFLSACSSLSIATAYAMVANGVSSVIGYRWEIPDRYAPDLVRAFYNRLLGRPTVTIAEALRQAKMEFRDKRRADPIWAAPMLLTRSRAELS